MRNLSSYRQAGLKSALVGLSVASPFDRVTSTIALGFTNLWALNAFSRIQIEGSELIEIIDPTNPPPITRYPINVCFSEAA